MSGTPNLLGQTEPIAMRAVEENGRVSYVGSFDSEPQRALRFKVTATSAATRR